MHDRQRGQREGERGGRGGGGRKREKERDRKRETHTCTHAHTHTHTELICSFFTKLSSIQANLFLLFYLFCCLLLLSIIFFNIFCFGQSGSHVNEVHDADKNLGQGTVRARMHV